MRKLIKNATIVNEGSIRQASLVIEDDIIKEICEDESRCLTNLILAELGQERDTVCRYCSTCQRGKRGTGR